MCACQTEQVIVLIFETLGEKLGTISAPVPDHRYSTGRLVPNLLFAPETSQLHCSNIKLKSII